jgi:hypothetical protein
MFNESASPVEADLAIVDLLKSELATDLQDASGTASAYEDVDHEDGFECHCGACDDDLVPVDPEYDDSCARLEALYGDQGMATAEYALVTVAAAGFAGLLIVLLKSSEVRGLLMGIIQGALGG